MQISDDVISKKRRRSGRPVDLFAKALGVVAWNQVGKIEPVPALVVVAYYEAIWKLCTLRNSQRGFIRLPQKILWALGASSIAKTLAG